MWRHLMSSSNNYEKLDEIFGTQTEQISTAVVIPPTVAIQVPVARVSSGDDIEDDYQIARQKLNDLIDKSQQALDGMLNVALASDSPRAYEVVGQGSAGSSGEEKETS
jgi:crotonobetainyl-CoA:carnitine CoA-transferase CaiB-like acyl-CoA transferase